MEIEIKAEEFLRQIFGEKFGKSHVTSFPDDPSNIPSTRRAICWAGGLKENTDLRDGENWYFCISLFSPDFMAGRAVRRKANFIAAYVIVLDDVEEKLPIEQVNRLPQPSYKLRTSINSYQWGYILEMPERSRNRLDNLTDQLIKNGLAPDGKDPGMRGVTRYVRIPGGHNTKAKRVEENGGTAPKCVLTEWAPQRKYKIEDLAAPFNVDLFATRSDDIIISTTSLPDHPILSMLNVKSELSPGRYDVTCPWVNEHTDHEDTGTALFTNQDGKAGFKCHHGHCESRTIKDVLLQLDKNNPGFNEQYLKWERLSVFSNASGSVPSFQYSSSQRKLQFRQVDFSKLPYIKWLIAGFIPEGFQCFSGLPGIGKSTIFASLAVVVTGFAEEIGAGITTDRQRVAIYVSEDVDQLSRIFYGYCKHFNIQPAELESRIKLVDAKRCALDELPAELSNLVSQVSDDTTDTPLLILDTASSLFDLDNENDNSEVAKFIAAVKNQIYESQQCPVWLITHAAKSSSKSSSDITPRGASAFIGDVSGTGSIYEVDGVKYFSIAKSRVGLDFPQIEFESVSKTEFTTDDRGRQQSQQIIISIPHQCTKPSQNVISPDLRNQQKRNEILAKSEAVIQYLKQQSKEHVAIAIKAGRGGSQSLPKGLSAKVIKWNDVFSKALEANPQTSDEKLIKKTVLENYQPDEGEHHGWHVWASTSSNSPKGFSRVATFEHYATLN